MCSAKLRNLRTFLALSWKIVFARTAWWSWEDSNRQPDGYQRYRTCTLSRRSPGSSRWLGLRGGAERLEPATRPLSAPAGKFRIRRAQTRHFKLEGGIAEQ